MSDVNRDPDADWALASAYVDGDVDAVERTLVESDDELRAIVQRMTGVRAALAEPVVVAEEQRRSAIAAALAVDRATTQSDEAARSETVVVPLARRRTHRAGWFGGAAAAAIVAVLVGVAVRDGSDTGDLRTASEAVATTTGVGLVQAASPGGGAPDDATDADADATAVAASDAAAAAGTTTTLAGATAGAAPAAPSAERAASAPVEVLALDRPEQLLDLPSTVTPTTAVAAASTADADSGATLFACVGSGEVLLALITYRGIPAIATIDVQAHVRRARAITGCTVLTEIADPS